MNRKPSVSEKVIRGARAGAVPGIVIGILSFPANYYFLAIKYRDEISNALGKPYTPNMQSLIAFSVATAVILTTCGILYALLYIRLPSNVPFWIAFPLGLAVFLSSRVGDMIRDYPISPSLVIDNALFSVLFLLFLYPYLVSRLYPKSYSNH